MIKGINGPWPCCPVEQGHDKYNSFLISMFILRADASGTEMLILIFVF